ncbi:MAG: hypothetical protein EOO43_09915 [Flavobacterium sp.]|nr:MAG: hypothetical protein EOO43_09915 [Flavobacterium sp.]
MFTEPGNNILNFYQPTTNPDTLFTTPVYRYMEEKWVDEFFKTGSLKISSFKKFRTYKDENKRRDDKEGIGTHHIIAGTEGNFHFVQRGGNDFPAYMLSTSLIYSDELKDEFETEACFKINDPANFAVAVSNAIKDSITRIFLGLCNYDDRGYLEITTKMEITRDFIDNFDLLNPNMGGYSSDEMMVDLLFIKRTVPYKKQAEFRFAWIIDLPSDKAPDDYIVFCPEAIKYCEKM